MQLEELAITGEEHVHPNSWAIGLSSVPDSWRSMKRLKRLQLQGHTILEVGSSESLLTWRLNDEPAEETCSRFYNSSQHQSQRLTALFKQHSQQIILQRREGSKDETSCSATGEGASAVVSHANIRAMSVQALPDWLAELQITNLDVSFCKGCNISVVSSMTSLQVLSLQVGINWDPTCCLRNLGTK